MLAKVGLDDGDKFDNMCNPLHTISALDRQTIGKTCISLCMQMRGKISQIL